MGLSWDKFYQLPGKMALALEASMAGFSNDGAGPWQFHIIFLGKLWVFYIDDPREPMDSGIITMFWPK
jgi:hypothetical protein